MTKSAQTEAPPNEEVIKLRHRLHREMVANALLRSKFVREKVDAPHDMVQAVFGDRFRVEEDELAAYNHSGDPIYSRSNPGRRADFDEALSILIDGHAGKSAILKSQAALPANTMKRKQFEALDQFERMSAMKRGVKLVD